MDNKFGLKNYVGAVHFVRGARKAGANSIQADKHLNELGRKASLDRLTHELRKVWTEDIHADYLEAKQVNSALINLHNQSKPKKATPTESSMIAENRANKLLMTQIALTANVKGVLAMLQDIATNGTPTEKTALLVNFGDIMTATQNKIVADTQQEQSTVNVWGTDDKLGEVPSNANALKAVQQAELTDKLKDIYNATTNSLKTKQELAWEEKMAEYVDADAEADSDLRVAERLFVTMWKDEFNTDFVPTSEGLDIWSTPTEDEFLTAVNNVARG